MKNLFRYFLPFGLFVVCCIAASIFRPMASASAVPGEAVSLADLYAIAIHITGVTVPLIIIYWSGPRKEIRDEMANDVRAGFQTYSIPMKTFISTCVDMRNGTTGSEPASNDTRKVFFCEKVLKAKESYEHTKARYAPIDVETIEHILPHQHHHAKFFSYFHNDKEDQHVCLGYIVGLTVLSIACFAVLYGRFLDGPAVSSWTAQFERTLVLATVGANFLTYAMLAWFVRERAYLSIVAHAAIWRCLPEVESDVKLHNRESSEDVARARNRYSGTAPVGDTNIEGGVNGTSGNENGRTKAKHRNWKKRRANSRRKP